MLSPNSKVPTAIVLCALSPLLLTACFRPGPVKPDPPVEVRVVRETPPAALLVKPERPAYQPGRPWGELPPHVAELHTTIDLYECQINRLVEWGKGGDPAKVECKAPE